MTELSRRSFITRSAAGAASLSLVGAAAAKANAAPSIKFDETYDVSSNLMEGAAFHQI